MIRSALVATTGLKLARTPSVRDQARRRWLVVLGAMLGLAAGGVALGLATAPERPPADAERTGPFSYFPSQ
jgi:hypothetical protein